MAVIFLLLTAVVVVWFGYAVAHTGKSMRTDLIVLFSTVPPFLLASIGLWLLGGKLWSRIRLIKGITSTDDGAAPPNQ